VHFTDTLNGFAAGEMGRIKITSNGGNIWYSAFTNIPNHINFIFFPNNSTGYAVGDEGLIIKTKNSGLVWEVQSYNTSNWLYSVFMSDPKNGIAVGDSGIILRTTNGGDPIGIKPISNEISDKFVLYQNYPNPFNPSTVISYELRITSDVKLSIFNAAGKLITEIVHQKHNAGKYEIEFNAENLPSGVYFYQLTIGNEQSAIVYNETKKMILLK
jgi:hypothetical protein